MKLFRKIKRKLKKAKRWVFHPVKSSKSYVNRKVKKTSKNYLKAIIIAYVITLIPLNYINIGNDIENFRPSNVISVLKTRSLPNILTGNVFNKIKDTVGFGNSDGNIEIVDGVSIENNDNLKNYPSYYAKIGSSNINEEDFPKIGTINYLGLDNLGRTKGVYGSLTHKMVEERKGIRLPFSKDSDPSGWGNNEKVTVNHPDGKVYHGYFWNRSHLIANQLGGSANRDNLITGTRGQNVGSGLGGMRYTEQKAVDYLSSNKNAILYYSAVPYYLEDEIIPRYVIVSMKSKDGSIDESVKVFNEQNGYTIDYKRGTFKINK